MPGGLIAPVISAPRRRRFRHLKELKDLAARGRKLIERIPGRLLDDLNLGMYGARVSAIINPPRACSRPARRQAVEGEDGGCV
jgi:hypothetical protein